jgi:hypothetical protein
MATWGDVERVVARLPEVSGDGRAWKVGKKPVAWERPLRKGDLVALGFDPAGDPEPYGPVLCARVPDEGAKQALLADDPDVYFTTPHFNGYPAILVRLKAISRPELRELLTEAWLAQAPKRLAAAYLASRSGRRSTADS